MECPHRHMIAGRRSEVPCYISGVPPSILWGSPLPPTHSGVSDYAVEMLSSLSRLTRVRVLVPPGRSNAEVREMIGGAVPVAADAVAESGEVEVLHLGNNPYHAWLLPRLDPGGTVVVMHDLVLHHLLVESTLAQSRGERYAQLLGMAHGEVGNVLVRARRWGMTGVRDPFLFPARRAFLTGQRGVVVHSAWARRQLRHELPDLPVGLVPLPVADPGAVDRQAQRRRLGTGEDELVLMHLGFLTREKGLEIILSAVAVAAACGVNLRLVTVGEGRGADLLLRGADRAGIGDRVTCLGWVEQQELRTLPSAADLGVVLRTPSAGETSAAALRFMACGTPVAVVGGRQFLEWPESAAPRVVPGPCAAASLARVVLDCWRTRSDGAWERRRSMARRTFLERHRPESAAVALLGFLEGLS